MALPAREPRPLPSDTIELVRRGGSGDRQAMEALIGLYQGRIAKFVIAETRDDAHYEDLCQAAFVKMVLALPTLRAAERFEPWLYQIARNVCRDHLRGKSGWRRLFVRYQPEHDAVEAAVSPAGRDNDATLEQGIARLPPEQQLLLRLSLEEKRSYEDLARLSQSTVSAVKSRLYRARENLRGILLAGEPK
jgi:RNA polymerase sigma-70 factor (ECF subfamily)